MRNNRRAWESLADTKKNIKGCWWKHFAAIY